MFFYSLLRLLTLSACFIFFACEVEPTLEVLLPYIYIYINLYMIGLGHIYFSEHNLPSRFSCCFSRVCFAFFFKTSASWGFFLH